MTLYWPRLWLVPLHLLVIVVGCDALLNVAVTGTFIFVNGDVQLAATGESWVSGNYFCLTGQKLINSLISLQWSDRQLGNWIVNTIFCQINAPCALTALWWIQRIWGHIQADVFIWQNTVSNWSDQLDTTNDCYWTRLWLVPLYLMNFFGCDPLLKEAETRIFIFVYECCRLWPITEQGCDWYPYI